MILKDLKHDVDGDDDYDNDDECIAWRGNGFITELDLSCNNVDLQEPDLNKRIFDSCGKAKMFMWQIHL